MLPSTIGFPFWFFQPPPSGPATQLEVIVPPETQVGIPASVEVIALSASNQRVNNYTGIIHFTSSDGNAMLPGDYTFGPQNHGAAYFRATFETTGSQTLTATDTVTASITGSAATMVNPAPVATHFLVVARGSAATGQAFTITVTALDASNHKVPNYTGTIHFSSTDSTAGLPANATLTAGVGKFSVTLNTAGAQTVSATDITTASLTGKATIQVSVPGVATHFAVFAFPVAQSGQSFEIFVAALDVNNKLASSYSGTVQFSSTDTSTGATLPPNSTLTGGIGVFSATLVSTGRQSITVTDVSNSSITGTAQVYVHAYNQHGWNGWFGEYGRG